MTTFNELYKEMGELLSKYPEIGELEMCACGVDSRLNIFRQEPDGPVTGVSLEDASYMEGHISHANNLIESLGVSLSSQHMEYLIQMCMEESSDKEMRDFIKQYSLSKNNTDLLVYKSEELNIEVYYSNSDDSFFIEGFSSFSAGEISEYIKNKYQVEIPWFEFVAGYFKEEFSVNPELSMYHLQKFENLDECLQEQLAKKDAAEFFSGRLIREINVPLKEKIDVVKEKTVSSKNSTRKCDSISRNGYPEKN